MSRNSIVNLAAVAALGLSVLAPTIALAGGGGGLGGPHGGSGNGFGNHVVGTRSFGIYPAGPIRSYP